MLEQRARARRRRSALGVGQRARAALRGRALRRGDGRLRRAQLLRPRSRPARDGARRAARRSRRRARDHDADAPAAVDVLPRLVRPRRAADRARRRRQRRLQLPAELGQALPGAARARAAARRRRPRRDPLPADGRAASSRSTRDAGHDDRAADRGARPRRRGPRRRRCCAQVEDAAARRAPPVTASCSPTTPDATIAAGGKRLRPLLVLLAGGAPRSRGARPGRSSGRQPRSSSCTARRSSTTTCSTAPRCVAAAPRSFAAAGREMASATGDLLFSRAFALLAEPEAGGDAGDAAASVRVLSGACSALARGELRPARRRLGHGDHARALRAALRAEDGAALRRPAASWANWRPASRSRSATSGAASGSPSRCSTTCSTSPARPSARASTRGTDLLDGTVTLPLILARERDPELAALDLRALAGRRGRGGALRPDRRDGCARGRSRAPRWDTSTKQRPRCRRRLGERRAALELVADGVVERYS